MRFWGLALVILALVAFTPRAKAQTEITSLNVLTPTVGAWVGSVPGQNAGYSGGGNGPAFNAATNTLIFGYTTRTATQTITAEAFAIQHALNLSNSGIRINGYNYSWYINNSGDQRGTLSGQVNFLRGGTSLRTDTYNYDAPTNGFELRTGTQTFATQESMLAGDSMTLSFTGRDNRFWAGYYGPQVRDPSITLNYTNDPCMANPLSSPSCSGYAAAYQAQMCSANPLYNSACPGYTQAYFTQQCTVNSLFDPSCPGYAAAYLTYQCSINPLFSTTCSGYAEAYKAQQCSLDGLYDRTCPNYADAYSRKYVIGIPSSGTISYGPADSRCTVGCGTTTTQNPNAGPATSGYSGPGATNVSTTQPVTSISNSGQISTGVAVTNDSNVNSVIATPRMDGPAASTGNSPVASSMNSPGPAASGSSTQTANVGPATKQEQKQEDRKAENKPEGGQPQGGQQGGQQEQKSDQPKTARQELQERRQEAAKAKAVEQGKDLANSMGKATDMEQQKQIQNVVIQAMGFTPGFDAYKVMIPDVAGYKPYSVYGNQRNVDNRSARSMFGGTDQLHNELVKSQYK
jgi:hypothetical protein